MCTPLDANAAAPSYSRMIAGLPSPFETFIRNLVARLTSTAETSTALHHCPACGHWQLVSQPHHLIAEDTLRLPPPRDLSTPTEEPARPRLVSIEANPVLRPNRDHLIQVVPELEDIYQPATLPPAARRRGR